MITFFSASVIISVMTFEGTDCRLAEIGKLADATGGRVRSSTIHIKTQMEDKMDEKKNANIF